MSDYDYGAIANDYDDLLKQYQWTAPELIFACLSAYVQSGTRLLDIGVGTGIGSQRFHEEGVELYGLDNSEEMLAVCRAKQLFKEVQLIDLLHDPLPYPDATFEYVISSGVFHFFADLDTIFAEVARMLKPEGLFAFTMMENRHDVQPYFTEITDGMNIYHHSKDYVEALGNQLGFSIVGEEAFTTLKNLETKATSDHLLMVLRKKIGSKR